MATLELARESVAQIWCTPENSHKIFDPILAESMAQLLCNWMETAAQESRNRDYYRGLLINIGELFGNDAHIADDGSYSTDVLCAKVPDLVTERINRKY